MDDRPVPSWASSSAPRSTPDGLGSTAVANGTSAPAGAWPADRKSTADRGGAPGAGMTPPASDGGYGMSNLTCDSPTTLPGPRSMSDSLYPAGRAGGAKIGSWPSGIGDVSPGRRGT